METKPLLIEPGAKYFLKNTLIECNKFKEKHISFLFNLALTFGFFLICFLILYFRYKGHITPEEIKLKQKKEKEYIMTKLIQISDYKKKSSQNLITNLPEWSNNPEALILNRNTSIKNI